MTGFDPERCPICGKAASVATLKPFCSKRCADLDLGRWLTDAYAIPAADDEDDDEEALDPPPLPGHPRSA